MVTISSVPPLTFYGAGATAEASRDEAASNALGPLLQLGMERNKISKGIDYQLSKCRIKVILSLAIYHIVCF